MVRDCNDHVGEIEKACDAIVESDVQEDGLSHRIAVGIPGVGLQLLLKLLQLLLQKSSRCTFTDASVDIPTVPDREVPCDVSVGPRSKPLLGFKSRGRDINSGQN